MADIEQNDELNGNMQQLIAAKAEELFNLCDTEQKGFIIKKDMQRLRDGLGVEPEQLEDVFDSLDVDHNGYLTLEEFTCKIFLSLFIIQNLFFYSFQLVLEYFLVIK
jgi:Ras and EF-hand domain-containing protein